MDVDEKLAELEKKQEKLKRDTEQAVLAFQYQAQQKGISTSGPIISEEYQGRGNAPFYSYGGRARKTDISKL